VLVKGSFVNSAPVSLYGRRPLRDQKASTIRLRRRPGRLGHSVGTDCETEAASPREAGTPSEVGRMPTCDRLSRSLAANAATFAQEVGRHEAGHHCADRATDRHPSESVFRAASAETLRAGLPTKEPRINPDPRLRGGYLGATASA
jgi:hypothetical protein